MLQGKLAGFKTVDLDRCSRLLSIDARIKEEVASTPVDFLKASVGKIVSDAVLAEQLGVAEDTPRPQDSSNLFESLWNVSEMPVFLLCMV